MAYSGDAHMKYAFLFFIVLSISNQLLASDRYIKSFRDSVALSSISQFLDDAAEDVKVSTRISDHKMKIKDQSLCVVAPAKEALKQAELAIRGVLRLYPDEELPFEEAMVDLANYLDNRELKKCLLVQTQSHKKIQSLYYFDQSGEVQLKIDVISLVDQ